MFVRLLVVALNGTRGHREALFFRRRYEPGASVPRWLHKQIGIEPGGHRKRSESKVPIVFNAIYLWHIMTTCCVNFGEDRWELGRLRCPAARGETEFSVVCGGAPGFMKRGNKGNILYIYSTRVGLSNLWIQSLWFDYFLRTSQIQHSFEHPFVRPSQWMDQTYLGMALSFGIWML